MTARQAAYQVVLRVFEDDAYADRVLRTAAARARRRDRALAQRLAYGTVQRVRTLDHAIETLGKRPVRKLDPPVRAALRLGAYQLGFTDVPAHAAVNETVELVRSRAARARGRVHERRHAPALRRDRARCSRRCRGHAARRPR